MGRKSMKVQFFKEVISKFFVFFFYDIKLEKLNDSCFNKVFFLIGFCSCLQETRRHKMNVFLSFINLNCFSYGLQG